MSTARSMPHDRPVAPQDHLLLEARDIEKRFGGVYALSGASFGLRNREVHALVGDNGAGKSTLIKIISGVLRADGGQILLEGQPVIIEGPRAARALGIDTVYQQLALVDHLDAAGNLFLGRETRRRRPLSWLGFIDHAEMRRRAAVELSRLRIRVPSVRQPVRTFSGGQRQAVAVARALAWGSRIVIMDEPTAALGVRERGGVLELIREVVAQGVSIIMVSHNLPEVFAVADRITVMRLGVSIATFETAAVTLEEIVSMMTGATATAA
ncbi:MAG: ATP-binding cassette domain-containing protein [Gaiellaceae bacterium]